MTVRPEPSRVDDPGLRPGPQPASTDEAGAVLEALLRGTGSDFLVLTDLRLRITRAGSTAARLAERPTGNLAGMSLIAAFGSVANRTSMRSIFGRPNAYPSKAVP